ncbi:hypothetical protein F4778DRAFT_77603 [Xylariomycetidae sp. FL2044]|nr:hypothetical protein F4778DRAFT_77603 [Xylariomycetidae sp. FL2044]
MASFLKPRKGALKGKNAFQIKPKGAAVGTSIKEVLQRNRSGNQPAASVEPTNRSSTPKAPPPSTSSRRQPCPQAGCPNPSAPVVDGFCSSCGREIDSSNIVAEVQFGESSNGAAVAFGTFVGADQGTVSSRGPGGRQMGGDYSANRNKTLNDARDFMQGLKHQLNNNMSESAVDEALRLFKMALNDNWLQGRGMEKVAAVCLYTACRKQTSCSLMLLDFSELIHVNVYDLGRVFKDFTHAYYIHNNQIRSVIPEDLILRFAEKLDFGELTRDVAADATRLCQRMGRDWMIMGRRPSGICGACLIMAARMWNFRRTVREIVYVVKVTTATIEARLEEFNVTESSELSIEDFLNNEFLESRHDPPSFYKDTAEWQEKMEKKKQENPKKRKRAITDIDDEQLAAEIVDLTGELDGQQSGNSAMTPRPSPGPVPPKEMPPPPRPRPLPDISKLRKVTDFLPRSFDSQERAEFIEPFDPNKIPKRAPRVAPRPEAALEVAEGLAAENPSSEEAIDGIAEIYGDAEGQVEGEGEGDDEDQVEEDETIPHRPGKRRRRKDPDAPIPVVFDEEWENDEAVLEQQINEVINDPHSDDHRKALATAAHVAHIKAEWARSLLPQRTLKLDEIIGEDEFADDPEVQFCKMSPEEVKIKESIWLNTNKEWLRKQQEKEYRKQMDALGPPKRKRHRTKKPRIGEGQLTPASSPAEAAVQALKNRNTHSKRINYDAITNLFEKSANRGPGSVVSRMTSRAGSVSHPPTPAASIHEAAHSPKAAPPPHASEKGAEAEEPEEEEEEMDEQEEEEEDYDNTYDDDQPNYDEDDWNQGGDEEEWY